MQAARWISAAFASERRERSHVSGAGHRGPRERPPSRRLRRGLARSASREGGSVQGAKFPGKRDRAGSRQLDVPGESEGLQRANAQPVRIELVPCEAVAGTRRVRVMIVVPAFTERQQRHPPVVGGVIPRLGTAANPTCGSLIYQPGRVKTTVVRKKIPQSAYRIPPKARRPTPTITFEVQCHLENATWTGSRARSGA